MSRNITNLSRHQKSYTGQNLIKHVYIKSKQLVWIDLTSIYDFVSSSSNIRRSYEKRSENYDTIYYSHGQKRNGSKITIVTV